MEKDWGNGDLKYLIKIFFIWFIPIFVCLFGADYGLFYILKNILCLKSQYNFSLVFMVILSPVMCMLSYVFLRNKLLTILPLNVAYFISFLIIFFLQKDTTLLN